MPGAGMDENNESENQAPKNPKFIDELKAKWLNYSLTYRMPTE
jgi:hypothetical protein